MSQTFPDLLRRAAAAQREGRRVAACLVVSAHGSTPQPAGALMFVDDAGGLLGTIGGGCVEAEVRRRGQALLAGHAGQAGEVLRLRLDHDYGWDDGLICGGTMEVALGPAPEARALEALAERIEQRRDAALELPVEAAGERFTLHLAPRARLLIAGAGHVGAALARYAVALEFDTTLFDDRADLLGRAPRGVHAVCGPIAACLSRTPLDESTACVIVTRGHRHDQQALAAVLERIRAARPGPMYVGMIGSRRKVKVIFDDLAAGGIPPELLARVRAPVGVPIGAQTVEEIALSIAAELVQVRSASAARPRRVERRPLEAPPAAHASLPTGVLLAAGEGRRMGGTKQLLPLPEDGRCRALVAAAFDAIAGRCRRVVVVVGHESGAVLRALAGREFTPAHSRPGAPMSASVRAGLEAALRIDAHASVLLHLADHPRVGPRTLDLLLGEGAAKPDQAIIPVHAGRRGHPVLIPARLVAPIAASELPGGLRGWWRDHPEVCVELPVDDASVLLDVDTPEHYRALAGLPPAPEIHS